MSSVVANAPNGPNSGGPEKTTFCRAKLAYGEVTNLVSRKRYPPHVGAQYPMIPHGAQAAMKPPQLDSTHILGTPKVPTVAPSGQNRPYFAFEKKEQLELTGKFL
jgi:hypothetical protein